MIGGYGILILIIGLIARLVRDIKIYKINHERMAASKDGTYVDYKGVTRLVKNGHIVDIESDYDRGCRLVDLSVNPHKVIKDIGGEKADKEFEIKRKKYFEELKNKGKYDTPPKSTMVYDEFNKHTYDEVKGVRLKDYKTGALYVRIKYDRFWWYMDVNTKKLVRLADNFENVRRIYDVWRYDYFHLDEAKLDNSRFCDGIKDKEQYKRYIELKFKYPSYAYCSRKREAELKAKFVYNNSMETDMSGYDRCGQDDITRFDNPFYQRRDENGQLFKSDPFFRFKFLEGIR